jgi:hypothetical protein
MKAIQQGVTCSLQSTGDVDETDYTSKGECDGLIQESDAIRSQNDTNTSTTKQKQAGEIGNCTTVDDSNFAPQKEATNDIADTKVATDLEYDNDAFAVQPPSDQFVKADPYEQDTDDEAELGKGQKMWRTINSFTTQDCKSIPCWFKERVCVQLNRDNTAAIIKQIDRNRALIELEDKSTMIVLSDEVSMVPPQKHDLGLATRGANKGVEGRIVCFEGKGAILKVSKKSLKLIDRADLAKLMTKSNQEIKDMSTQYLEENADKAKHIHQVTPPSCSKSSYGHAERKCNNCNVTKSSDDFSRWQQFEGEAVCRDCAKVTKALSRAFSSKVCLSCKRAKLYGNLFSWPPHWELAMCRNCIRAIHCVEQACKNTGEYVPEGEVAGECMKSGTGKSITVISQDVTNKNCKTAKSGYTLLVQPPKEKSGNFDDCIKALQSLQRIRRCPFCSIPKPQKLFSMDLLSKGDYATCNDCKLGTLVQRLCSHCGIFKTAHSFSKTQRSHGKSAKCKDCVKAVKGAEAKKICSNCKVVKRTKHFPNNQSTKCQKCIKSRSMEVVSSGPSAATQGPCLF